jgi:hypothetical protein
MWLTELADMFEVRHYSQWKTTSDQNAVFCDVFTAVTIMDVAFWV